MTTSMCLPTVYLNGEFMPFENAKISPLDRGFIFGDGAYEVIPFYASRGLRAVEHLEATATQPWMSCKSITPIHSHNGNR
ncbi:MAG: hypothetical protein IPP88_05255 [Betaproteobacteria bacterium]|nr:hypothetical protein [Betaproteobacteria bacterium]